MNHTKLYYKNQVNFSIFEIFNKIINTYFLYLKPWVKYAENIAENAH